MSNHNAQALMMAGQRDDLAFHLLLYALEFLSVKTRCVFSIILQFSFVIKPVQLK
jgi:hypothetical protein